MKENKKLIGVILIAVLIALSALSSSTNLSVLILNATNFTINVSGYPGQPGIDNNVTLICVGNTTCTQNNANHSITITSTGGGGNNLTQGNGINLTPNPITGNGTVSVNATLCNPANQFSVFNNNWMGLGFNGFDCVSSTDDDSAYVPYTGATGNVDLGTHDISTNNVNTNDIHVNAPYPAAINISDFIRFNRTGANEIKSNYDHNLLTELDSPLGGYWEISAENGVIASDFLITPSSVGLISGNGAGVLFDTGISWFGLPAASGNIEYLCYDSGSTYMYYRTTPCTDISVSGSSPVNAVQANSPLSYNNNSGNITIFDNRTEYPNSSLSYSVNVLQLELNAANVSNANNDSASRYNDTIHDIKFDNVNVSLSGKQSIGSYETTSNKSVDTALGLSDLLFPSQKAVKTYVDLGLSRVSTVSAGAGVEFFYNNSVSDISGFETISKTPDVNTEQDESTSVTNNMVLFEKYMSNNTGLGGSQIDAGQWNFEVYSYVSAITGDSELVFNVSKVTNDGKNATELFNVSSGNITSTVTTLYNINSVQQSFLINASDRLVVNVSAKTNSTSAVTVHFVHSGTAHYSNIHTPLVIRHNDLSGLQGGTFNDYQHLTTAQLTQVTNQPGIDTSQNGYISDLQGTDLTQNISINGKEPTITGSTNNVFLNGLKQWIPLSSTNISDIGNYLLVTVFNTALSNQDKNNTAINNSQIQQDTNQSNQNKYSNATYEYRSNKSVANGYAGLDAGALVPTANLATGTPDGTKFLRDDRTWAAAGSGSGTSFARFNHTMGAWTTNILNYTFGAGNTVLSLPLTSGKMVVGECGILTNASLATISPQMFFNITGNNSMTISVEYYTSTTIQALVSGGARNTSMVPTTSGGTLITPIQVQWHSNQIAAGFFNVSMKASAAGRVQIDAGSYCRSIEI